MTNASAKDDKLAATLEQSLRGVEAEAARLAEEAARLRERYAERAGEPDAETVREAREEIDELRARFMRQLDEHVPAPPIERAYERLGTRPASEEQYERFLAEHGIPTKEA